MHTPAPWRVGKGDPKKENLVAEVRGLTVFGPYCAATCGEDARLVAAAPDLLAACKAAQAWVEWLTVKGMEAEGTRRGHEAWDAMKAAIEKAEGETL